MPFWIMIVDDGLVYMGRSRGHRSFPPLMKWSDLTAHPWSNLDPYIGHLRPGIGTFFLTRVLDVKKVSLGIISLRNREEVKTEYPAYWTLSHRWGDPSQIQQLLKTTEQKLRKGISLGDLSHTFRDAALLVYRLGYRYIWIDSLCIFQDSKSDWQHESGTMADIYRHSLCNISAISSSIDPSSGLFHYREHEARLLFPFRISVRAYRTFRTSSTRRLSVGRWMIRNDSAWVDDVENAPLSTHGWVL
ncbi:HET-domain-containing protein [Hypoxylon sp. EC38]|nr:HET-domain-containing protein [Hypoxylon sp. EC38]